MIDFNYETDFQLNDESEVEEWLIKVINLERHNQGEINYIFCNDEYLHKLNVEFLEHDTLTDIITFDYSVGKELHADIYISVERVRENSVDFDTGFSQELLRVIVHGVLHLCGYKDRTEVEKTCMRSRENHYMQLILGDS